MSKLTICLNEPVYIAHHRFSRILPSEKPFYSDLSCLSMEGYGKSYEEWGNSPEEAWYDPAPRCHMFRKETLWNAIEPKSFVQLYFISTGGFYVCDGLIRTNDQDLVKRTKKTFTWNSVDEDSIV